MVERFMALVLKAKVFLNTVGSNPTPPEIILYIYKVAGQLVCYISTPIRDKA